MKRQDGYVRLARAVIASAIQDARNHEDARLFLTADSGEWKRSRDFWCEVACVNSDALRERFAFSRPKAQTP